MSQAGWPHTEDTSIWGRVSWRCGVPSPCSAHGGGLPGTALPQAGVCNEDPVDGALITQPGYFEKVHALDGALSNLI